MVALNPINRLPQRDPGAPPPTVAGRQRSVQATLSAVALNGAVATASVWSTVQQWALALPAEMLLVFGLAVMSVVAHGLNMFNNPGYTRFGDEGIYVSQAWSVLRQGQLSPYTYFYDHAPAGWLMLAAWMWFTGGVQAMGSALDSGRMFMLVLHVAMVPLLYHLARKLGCRPAVAALAVMLFSVSPVAVFYQRLVLLDNFMLFWMLLSLDLLLNGWGRLSRIVLSGICFGLALLSKETAIFFVPAMLYIAWQDRWRHQGKFAVVGWLLPMGAVTSLYPLYSLFKGELLPSGLVLDFFFFRIGSLFEHVSLIDTLRWQMQRGGGGMFNLNNDFWLYTRTEWLPRDAFLYAGGVVAIGLNLLRGLFRDRRALATGLLGLFPLYYLARGGLVFEFYLMDVIPFLCLNLAVLVAPVFNRLRGNAGNVVAAIVAVAIVTGYLRAGTLQPLYTLRPADAARESVAWIKRNIPPESVIVTHDDPWTDLREPGFGGPAFPNVHFHSKVALDPAVHTTLLQDNWRNIDYLLINHDLRKHFKALNNKLAQQALANAQLVKRWKAVGAEDTVELWKVNKVGLTETVLLGGAQAYLAERFHRNGAMVAADGTVTSQSQAAALLRAVWTDDQAGFRRIWSWTRTNVQTESGLLAWKWRDGTVLDRRSATDADTDTALALLFAGKRWQDPELLDAGRRMVHAIWEHEVVTVRGVPYALPGDWARTPSNGLLALNPGVFAPYAYEVFAEVDPDHAWHEVVESSYRVLSALSQARFGPGQPVGLPPDWVGFDPEQLELVPLPAEGMDLSRYGSEAARAYWRVALHHAWSQQRDGEGDARAGAFLQTAGFLRNEVKKTGRVAASYSRNGSVVAEAPTLVGTAGALAALLTLDRPAAEALYAGHLVGGVTRLRTSLYWGNPIDLSAQEWGWLATALYAGKLPNLWLAA